MWGRGLVFAFSVFLVAAFPLSSQTVDQYSEILEDGRQAVKQGNPDKALEIWSKAADRFAGGITDPRIGIAYIELATDLKMTDYYNRAVEMYHWGFSNPGHSDFEDALSEELERIKPIISRKNLKQWRKLLKDEKYRDFGREVLKFWSWMDPTATSSYNERLIEHWSRIAYSREHFTRNKMSTYRADERAEIYVKYGQPDRIDDGIMSFSSGIVQSWIQQAFQIQLAEFEDLPMATDSISQAMARQLMRASVMRKRDQIMEYERNIRFQHNYPYYEIWVYRDILENNLTPLIFIFGNDGDTGQFGKLRSVEDMMPNAAFRASGLQMEIPPSFFLQLMYYQDLVTVDHYFERAFQDLQTRLYNLNGVNRWDSRQLRHQNESKLIHARMKAPEERSTLGEEFPSIPLDVHQFRLLNQNNEPVLATFLMSNPYRAYFLDQMMEREFNLDAYNLSGSVVGVDEQNDIVFRANNRTQQLREVRNFRGNVDRIPPEITYFELPNERSVTNQKFTVELLHKFKDSTKVGENLFQEHIRAIGGTSHEQIEPITIENGELEMGDLLVGVREDADDSELPFGFRVQPDATIDKGENLIVHIEVYNLNGSEGNPKPFQINYVASEKAGFFKRLFTKRDKVGLSLNFEATADQFRENLEIDTSPFEAGDYTLELRATEPGTDREVSRSVGFTIEAHETEQQEN
ncbi:MAG: GWxTD domain-containing protein [Balneolaceae bacterium]|nr:GWxTD domain-containing protein [Balneolaceae bacterium]